MVVAAPILSTNLSEPLYRQFMPCDPFELTRKQLKTMHRNFIPITKSQLNSCYAALATVYGGFGNYIEITVQFWKSSADALLGTSASVSSVTSETPAYGLKTADIASCTLIGLFTRSKLLQEKAKQKKQEVQLQTQSKQIYRSEPPQQLVG